MCLCCFKVLDIDPGFRYSELVEEKKKNHTPILVKGVISKVDCLLSTVIRKCCFFSQKDICWPKGPKTDIAFCCRYDSYGFSYRESYSLVWIIWDVNILQCIYSCSIHISLIFLFSLSFSMIIVYSFQTTL